MECLWCLNQPKTRIRLVLLSSPCCDFLIVNKSCEKTKANREMIAQTALPVQPGPVALHCIFVTPSLKIYILQEPMDFLAESHTQAAEVQVLKKHY